MKSRREEKTKQTDQAVEEVKQVQALAWKEKLMSDFKSCLKDISWKNIGILFLWALAVNLLIEILGQFKYGGVLEAFKTIAHSPLVFLYNSLIIMVTISICQFFKRSYFWMVLFSCVWIGLGVANFIILSYRVTPFSAVELKLIDAAMGVMKSYVSIGATIMVLAMIVIAVGAVIWLWKKAPARRSVNYFTSALEVAALALLLSAATRAGLSTNVIATRLPNLSESYVEYGFVYCFSNSLVNTGINKPRNYSEEKVTAINKTSQKKLSAATGVSVETDMPVVTSGAVEPLATPNIIFLQLESFFDITAVEGLQLSEDPIPFFRNCMTNYPSGYLSVPVVGAGTANTEFEIITGMNLDFFGPGEYPYKTVLKDHTCETMAYNLKKHGYTAHAMHNNRASFYGRNEVFARFGFDIFTSMELMDITEYTENGWAKDKILTGELMKSLRATQTPDYVYAISVQGHGGYPTEPSAQEQKIKVLGGVESEANKNAIQYYVNQIYEMDEFLKELTDQLTLYKQETGEDTILVAYGDHLPSLGIEEDDIVNKDMYQTQYFAWNTMNLPNEKEDVQAYQISSRILGMIGVSNGEINAFHQANKGTLDEEQYLEDLKVLGYDMFYGDHYAVDTENEYQATDIKYGVTNVEIANVFRDQSDPDYLMIRGNYFTKYSYVYINDEKVNCERLDENTLRIVHEKVTEPIHVVVKQSYKGKLILQTSNEIIYQPDSDSAVPEPEDGNSATTAPEATPDSDLASMIDEEASEKK